MSPIPLAGPARSLLAALLLVSVPATAQVAADSAYAARADAYLAEVVRLGRFSGVVRVEAGGQVYERAVGVADAAGAPVRRDAVFRVGSVTKPMTAVAVLRLAERGLLGLDQPACGYAPDACRGRWADVTVRQLLNQTAGLPEYTARPTFVWMKNQAATPEALLASVRGVERVHPPGERFAYSNTHYVLLGAVLEAVAGRPYADVLAAEVAGPLGLEQAAYGPPPTVTGFTLDGTSIVPADSIDASVAFAAGGAVATAADVAAFLRGALGGPLLADSTRTAMLTPGGPGGYALGWVSVPYRGPVPALAGTRVAWHNGAIDGFRSLALAVPEREVYVAVLANLFDADADRIGADLVTLLGGDLPEPEPEAPDAEAVALPAADLAAVVGVYRLAEGFDVAVRVRDGRVFVQATGQGELEAFASAPDRFFLRAVPARLVFARGPDGRAETLTLLQGGAEVTGPRVE